MPENWIVIYGDLINGIQDIVGIFDSEEEAISYAEDNDLNDLSTQVYELAEK